METKVLTISLPKKMLEIINRDFNYIGNTESDRIQNIILSSLFLQKQNTKSKKHEIRLIKSRIDFIEAVISIIIDLNTKESSIDIIQN